MNKEILNEIDSLFKHVFKYYELEDKKTIKKQWNEIMQSKFKNLDIADVIGSDLYYHTTDFLYWYENKESERKSCGTIGDIVKAYFNSESYKATICSF